MPFFVPIFPDVGEDPPPNACHRANIVVQLHLRIRKSSQEKTYHFSNYHPVLLLKSIEDSFEKLQLNPKQKPRKKTSAQYITW